MWGRGSPPAWVVGGPRFKSGRPDVIYVYAESQAFADAWVRGQGIRPRDARTFGRFSRSLDGTRYCTGDRVVVLGQLSREVGIVLDRLLVKARVRQQVVEVERPAECLVQEPAPESCDNL